MRLDAKFRKSQICKSVRKAIRYYRGKTWEHQDNLSVERSITYYPEKFPGRCAYLRWNVKQWRTSASVHFARWTSVRNHPEFIIRALFPDATEHRALGVADCESNLDIYATNRTSGTASLFQIHPGNRGRTIYWRGHGSLVIGGNLYDPWNNTRIALYMSKGGYDWHEWASVCQR